MYKPASSKSPFTFSSATQVQRTAVGEFIRRAERSIAGQEYKMAQDLLAEAWRLDPGNPYIPAIVERVQILQGMASECASQARGSALGVLTLPVTAESPDRFKRDEGGEISRGKVRRLLTVATTLLERGSYQSAYESIIKAEELDPQDSEVQGLKAKVFPLYEASMTRRSEGSSPPARRGDSAGVAASLAGLLMAEVQKQQAAAQQTENALPTFEGRLAALRRQKEVERRESEHALWRESTQKRERSQTPTPPPPKSSFISTLLRGKDPR
jgi:tetratricopeptide (TPR) repeat protein